MRFKQGKILIACIICLAIFLGIPVYGMDTGLDTTAQTAYGTIPMQGSSISSIIGTIVGAALSLIGIVFFVLMIYGGFTWMIARGNDAEVTKAKDMITNAVIGLIIVFAAYAITKYIGGILSEAR
jgi:hypothetical protein